MQKNFQLSGFILIALMLSFASAGPLFAQSGSTGGSIGKTGKSATGGENEPRTAPPAARPGTAARETRGGGCGNFTGVWNSWATGMFGSGDVTVSADGSATHRSGIPGKWTCEGGYVMTKWASDAPGRHKMSRDGKRLTADDGTVYFWRVGAARYEAE